MSWDADERFEYNQKVFFLSDASIDGVPTARGIYHAIGLVGRSVNSNEETLTAVKQLVERNDEKMRAVNQLVNELKVENANLKSEMEVLKKAILTVRIRQEHNIMPLCMEVRDLATIIARKIAPDELAQQRHPIIVRLRDDPFADAPELEQHHISEGQHRPIPRSPDAPHQ